MKKLLLPLIMVVTLSLMGGQNAPSDWRQTTDFPAGHTMAPERLDHSSGGEPQQYSPRDIVLGNEKVNIPPSSLHGARTTNDDFTKLPAGAMTIRGGSLIEEWQQTIQQISNNFNTYIDKLKQKLNDLEQKGAVNVTTLYKELKKIKKELHGQLKRYSHSITQLNTNSLTTDNRNKMNQQDNNTETTRRSSRKTYKPHGVHHDETVNTAMQAGAVRQ